MKQCSQCLEEKDESLFPDRILKSGKRTKRAYCKECDAAQSRRWVLENPEKSRQRGRIGRWRRSYGLSPEQYYKILQDQGGCCDICKSLDPKTKYGVFVVDHDHETGNVRGLLCSTCNAGLGHFNDDPKLLRKAAKWLQAKKG